MSSPLGPEDLFERAACGLLVTAADGTILRANATLCAWLDYSAAELIGKRFQQLLTMGCKIFHQTHWMPLLQIQGSVAEVQLDVLHRSGRELPMLVNALVLADGPTPSHSISLFVAKDRRSYERELLLAKRRAEEALDRERRAQAALNMAEAGLRLALEAARLGVWHLDVRTRAASYGVGVGSLIGRPELEDIASELYSACIHPDDRAAEQAALEAALDPSKRATYAVEYKLNGHDGVQRVVSSTGRARFDESGELEGFSGVLRDVTEARQADRVLKERAVLAEQLVGIVSHDLRTPLNVITLGTHLLGTTPQTDVQARTTTRIASAATRATRLTADLLDFTQTRLGGGLRVALRETDAHALVADHVEELKLAWPGRMIEHVATGTGKAFCDPDRLAQIITNLANNALTYGRADAPITICSTVSSEHLEIQVHNSGPPIPVELLPDIFEPMRRGEQETKLGSRSVGLGLYIVRQIATAHGGQVEVKSNPREGTTFSVRVPRRPLNKETARHV
jgi:sigma-B regulation protein RsbU (phosphoserine phosphatase)